MDCKASDSRISTARIVITKLLLPLLPLLLLLLPLLPLLLLPLLPLLLLLPLRTREGDHPHLRRSSLMRANMSGSGIVIDWPM